VDVDQVVVRHDLGAPDVVEDGLAADDHPGFAGEEGEDVELDRGELDWDTVDTDGAPRLVEIEARRGGWRAGGPAPGPAEERLHPGDQLARAERLHQVVVGAHRETNDPIDLLAPRREHQDICVGERADLAARLQPVEPAALAELLPDTAERVTGDATETVPLASLAVGDIVLVRPGARVPADGAVDEGSADVDESMITGESQAVGKEPGDRVVAGTVAAGGSLRVRVTAVGEATALSGIMRMVAAAQASASRAQALADRAAAILFYVALSAGLITFAFWWIEGDHAGALTRMATVLVIACPHALGLAIPLVIAISTSLGARNGLLVKDRIALERARELDVVIFDKTGTLTKGTPVVAAMSGADETELLRLAASVEADSEHPLARAIVAAAAARGIEPAAATDFEALTGRGARAQVDGREVAIGGPGLLADLGLEADQATEAWAGDGRTVLHVIVDGAVLGALSSTRRTPTSPAFRATPRATSKIRPGRVERARPARMSTSTVWASPGSRRAGRPSRTSTGRRT
jgi:E1-E2 ATPase/haloacid dehalogenase-like hydrolase